jgi:hypothetical protein
MRIWVVGGSGETHLFSQLRKVLLKRGFDAISIELHVADGLVDGGADRSVHRGGYGLHDHRVDLLAVSLMLLGSGNIERVEDGLALWGQMLHDLLVTKSGSPAGAHLQDEEGKKWLALVPKC